MGDGKEPHIDLAKPVGKVIAELSCHLLTGGGGGVMEAISKAFKQERERLQKECQQYNPGLIIGIIRAKGEDHLKEQKQRSYKERTINKHVELAIKTHLPYSGGDEIVSQRDNKGIKKGKHELSRNHINVLTANVVIALPGGGGTASEVELAMEYKRPLILYIGKQTINGKSAESWQNENLDSDNFRIAKKENELKDFIIRVVSK